MEDPRTIDISVSGELVPPDSIVSIPTKSGDKIFLDLGSLYDLGRSRGDKPYYEYDQESLLDELRLLEYRMEEAAMFLSYIRAYKEEIKERYTLIMIRQKAKIKMRLEKSGLSYYKNDLEEKAKETKEVYNAGVSLRRAELLLELVDKAYWTMKDRMKNVSKAIDVKKSLLGDMNMV